MGVDEEKAFDAVFRSHHDAVFRYAVRRTGHAAAEDVVAETFLIAWRRRDQVPPDALPWLYAVARKLLANQRRAELRSVELVAVLETVELTRRGSDPVHEATEARAVADALTKLAPSDQEVLMLHAWEGLDRDAAALVLGCRPATYAVRLHRARRRLRAALETNTAPRSARRSGAKEFV